MTYNRNTPYFRRVQQDSLVIFGLVSLIQAIGEIYFLGFGLPTIVAASAIIFYLGIGLQRSWKYDVPKMSLFCIYTGLIYLTLRVWLFNGNITISASRYMIFPIYALLFNNPRTVKISAILSIFCALLAAYAIHYFPYRDYSNYPTELNTLLAIYLFPLLVYHLHVLAKSISHMDGIIEKQHSQALFHSQLTNLGRLAAQIAHEVNTPLTTLGFLAEQLKESMQLTGLSSVSQNLFILHQRVINRISNTMTAILRASRITADPAASPLNFTDLVQDIHILMDFRLRQKDVDFKMDVSTIPNEEVLLSHTLVIQTITTLMCNSLDAVSSSPNGVERPRTWIAVGIRIQEGALEINVTDSGPRIAPEHIPHLFKNGFTTKSDREFGYGLSVAKQLLSSRGGSITYHSESPHTHFRVRIPFLFTSAQNKKGA